MTHKDSISCDTKVEIRSESRDATATSLSPLNQSVNLELAQANACHLVTCIALSIVSCGLFTVLSSGATYYSPIGLWFAGLCLCTLGLWVYAEQANRKPQSAPAYLVLCALFWSLAAYLPLADNSLYNLADGALLTNAIILFLPAIWPGLYLQPTSL